MPAIGIITLVKSYTGESSKVASEKATLNDQILRKALSDGGYREIIEPGDYKFTSDNFAPAATSIVAVGPGIAFYTNGVAKPPSGLALVMRYLGARTNRILGAQNTDFTKTDANALETDPAAFSCFIPGNTLGPNDALKINYLISCDSASGAAKRLRGRFGGVVLWNWDLTSHVAYHGEYILRNTGTRAAQVAQPNSSVPFGTFGSSALQDFLVDFSNDQTFTLTLQWPVAGSGTNGITLRSVYVEQLVGPW